MVGTLTNQIPASSACKARMAHKACMACKARKVHKVRKARKVVGKISGFYVNEVFHFH